MIPAINIVVAMVSVSCYRSVSCREARYRPTRAASAALLLTPAEETKSAKRLGRTSGRRASLVRKIPHGELSIDPVADERLLRVTARAIWIEAGSIRARRVSGNGIVGEVHRSQRTNRLGQSHMSPNGTEQTWHGWIP